MAIKRTELQETEDQKAEREAKEKEEQEREDQRRQELEQEREARRKAELEAAKASGEAEALKRGLPSQPANPMQNWTEEQWDAEAQKNGFDNGKQFRAAIQAADAVSEFKAKTIRGELEEAKKEAREAKEEARKIRERKTAESVEQSFYDSNPALRLHKKHIDDFLSTYPDADTVGGEVLKKRLSLAADIVKGRVKEDVKVRNNRNGETGTSRFEGSQQRDDSNPEDIPEFDPKGSGNEAAAHLMRGVNSRFGQDLNHPDSLKVWKESLDDEGRGVSISVKEDFDRYNRLLGRDRVNSRE